MPMHFGTGKSRDVLCRACRRAWRDTLGTTSSTRTTRVQGRRHGVDWGGHVSLTFSRSCSWDWCKCRAQKTKLVHASTTAFSSSAMLEQARLDVLITMHSTCHTCCVEVWPSQVEFEFRPNGLCVHKNLIHVPNNPNKKTEQFRKWWYILRGWLQTNVSVQEISICYSYLRTKMQLYRVTTKSGICMPNE